MSIAFLQSNSDNVDRTIYTFSAENLGTASNDRYIAVSIAARAGGSRTLDSVTVNGQSATITVSNIVNTDTTNYMASAIALALVPADASGDVVVTFSNTMTRCAIALHRIDDLLSATATDTDVDSTPAQDIALTIDVPANGFVIATAFNRAVSTDAWSGVTENYGDTIEAANRFSGGMLEYPAGSAAQAISCDFSAGTESIAAAASWAFNSSSGIVYFF